MGLIKNPIFQAVQNQRLFKTVNTNLCRELEKSPIIQSLADIQAYHILSDPIKVTGSGWQLEKWQSYINDDLIKQFPEILKSSIIYGNSYTIYDIVEHDKIMIDRILPIDRDKVSLHADDIYYNASQLDKMFMAEYSYRQKQGFPEACDEQIGETVVGLTNTIKALPDAVIRNSLGMTNFYQKEGSFSYTSQEAINQLLVDFNNSYGLVTSIPDLAVDVVGNKDLRSYDGFDLAITKGLEIIYNYFGMAWLSLGVTETGAYNAYKAALDVYSKIITVRRKNLKTYLQDLADKEAYLNNEPCAIRFETQPLSFEIKPTLETVINTGKIKEYIDAGVLTVDEVRNKIGLPPLTIEVAKDVEKPLASFESLLNNKKIGVLASLRKALQNKEKTGALQFTLTDKDKFAKILGVDELTLETVWLDHSLSFKEVCRKHLETNEALENLFEVAWQSFAEKLRGFYAK